MDFIYFIDPQPDVEKLIKKLRVKVKIMERRGKNIEAIFEEADADNSNALSYTEFSKLLKTTCGLPLTDAQVRALVKRLDIDDDDEIDHFEFLDLVLPEEEEEVEPQVTKDKKQKQEKKENNVTQSKSSDSIKPEDWEKVKKILMDWVEAAEENLDTFEDEAENVAGDKATSIEDDEFIDCLLTAGCDKLSETQQDLVCKKFRAKGGKAMVDFVAFIDYCDKEHEAFIDSKEKKNQKTRRSKKKRKSQKTRRSKKERRL